MGVAKCTIKGSDYLGAFISATDKYAFFGNDVTKHNEDLICRNLGVHPVLLPAFGTSLIGLFIKANSNGMILSNLAEERQLHMLKEQHLDMNISVLESALNAVGNNILANDKIAIVNPDFDHAAMMSIRDALGVETIKEEIGGFKTVGANNILTNKGLVITNNATEAQKQNVDNATGFNAVSTTANTGALSLGLSVVANSRGIVVGDSTTGFELARIMEGLELNE